MRYPQQEQDLAAHTNMRIACGKIIPQEKNSLQTTRPSQSPQGDIATKTTDPQWVEETEVKATDIEAHKTANPDSWYARSHS